MKKLLEYLRRKRTAPAKTPETPELDRAWMLPGSFTVIVPHTHIAEHKPGRYDTPGLAFLTEPADPQTPA